MTTCSDEESFYASGNTDTSTLDPLGISNCYRVLPSYRYRYLIAANDDPIYYEDSAFFYHELDGAAVFGTSSSYGGSTSSLYHDGIWVWGHWNATGDCIDVLCKDAFEDDASTIHPTAVGQWDCRETTAGDFDMTDYISTGLCGCDSETSETPASSSTTLQSSTDVGTTSTPAPTILTATPDPTTLSTAGTPSTPAPVSITPEPAPTPTPGPLMPPTPAPISTTTAEPTASSTARDMPSTSAPILTTTAEPTTLSTAPGVPSTPAPISTTTAEPTTLFTAPGMPSTPAPILTSTAGPTALPTEPEGTPSPTRTIAPSPSSDGVPVGVVGGTVAGAVAIAAMGAFLWRRRSAKKKDDVPPPASSDPDSGKNFENGGERGQGLGASSLPSIVVTGGNRGSGSPSEKSSSPPPPGHSTNRRDASLPPPYQRARITQEDEVDECKRPESTSMAPAVTLAPPPVYSTYHHRDVSLPPPYQHAMVTQEAKVSTSTAPAAVGTVVPSSREKTAQRSGKDNDRAPAGGDDEVVLPTEQSPLHATNSTANVSTGERNDLAGTAIPPDNDLVPGDGGAPSMAGVRRTSDGGVGYGQAVMAAAEELAQHCQIPGVSEAATAVSILVRLVSDSRDYAVRGDAGVKRCRSIVMMLERAAKVLGKGGDTNGEAARALMEDVHDAVCDLVELIKTYQSKNRLSKVLMSTLFKRRQDELDAVVDRAILRLHLGLQVQVGHDVSEVKEVMHRHKGSMEEAMSESLAEARSARRQRRLDQLEIPEDHVLITDEVLGKGGFGEVFIADYNGRNAAAKVQHVAHGFDRLGEDNVLNGASRGEPDTQQLQKQRKAFLHELGAMIRLRSPHTVNVYGAITSLPNRLILVMELLAGGDLRSMLKRAEHPLPEAQCRQIMGDICAGMAFLHSKATVHGDLKSANILLDGRGRAKIGDFGTSRWAQNTENSTGLATYTTKAGQGTHISFAWTAPEVLETKAASIASDVYSFGVVVWEILTRQIPWAEQALPRDIYLRVVIRGERPAIPADAPADIVEMLLGSWAQAPEERPTFQALMDGGMIRPVMK